MPAGTPVVAARAGIVLDVTLRYTEGGANLGFLNKANTVSVLHDDGTVAEYAHLSPGPAVIEAGERVKSGDLLGYSGSTGYSSDPHLHFIVTETVIQDGKVTHESVPVRFRARDPSVRFSVQMGTTVWADYAVAISLAAVRPRRTP
jgi:murein DD-endopeptidase MepM/ murein hydrolase activator NlpD